jgi:hypothetical protein
MWIPRQELVNLLQFDRPDLAALEDMRFGHDLSVTESGFGVPKEMKLFLPPEEDFACGKSPQTTQRLVRLYPQPAEHLALRKNLRCALRYGERFLAAPANKSRKPGSEVVQKPQARAIGSCGFHVLISARILPCLVFQVIAFAIGSRSRWILPVPLERFAP